MPGPGDKMILSYSFTFSKGIWSLRYTSTFWCSDLFNQMHQVVGK